LTSISKVKRKKKYVLKKKNREKIRASLQSTRTFVLLVYGQEIFTRVMDVGFKFIFHGRLLLTVFVWTAVWSFNLIEFAPEIRGDLRWMIDRENLADEISDMFFDYTYIHIIHTHLIYYHVRVDLMIDLMSFFPLIGYIWYMILQNYES